MDDNGQTGLATFTNSIGGQATDLFYADAPLPAMHNGSNYPQYIWDESRSAFGTIYLPQNDPVINTYGAYHVEQTVIFTPDFQHRLNEYQRRGIYQKSLPLGTWAASAGEEKLSIQLGAGSSDGLADARLVVRDFGKRLFCDILEFAGDTRRYEVNYDYTGDTIARYHPVRWGQLDDTMNFDWWKPRFISIGGSDFTVQITKGGCPDPDVHPDFAMTIKLFGYGSPVPAKTIILYNPNGKPDGKSDSYYPDTRVLKAVIDGQTLTWTQGAPEIIGGERITRCNLEQLFRRESTELREKDGACTLVREEEVDGIVVHSSTGTYRGSPWQEWPVPIRILEKSGARITDFEYTAMAGPEWLSVVSSSGDTAPNYMARYGMGVLMSEESGYGNSSANKIRYSYTGSKLAIIAENNGNVVSSVEWNYANLLGPTCTAEGETTRYTRYPLITGGMNCPVATVTGPDNITTICNYAMSGGSVTAQTQRGSGAGAAQSTVTYNPQGYLAASQTIELGSSLTLDSYTASNFTAWGAPRVIDLLGGKQITNTYDGQSRLVSSKLTWGNLPEQTSSYGYDAFGRIKTVTVNGRTETHTYGGLSHTVTYPQNYSSKLTWDIWGQPLQSSSTFEPATSTVWTRGVGTPPQITTTETSSGRTWINEYDVAGNCIKQTGTARQGLRIEPQGTRVTYKPLADDGSEITAAAIAYEYDLLGRIKQVTAPNSTVTQYTYQNGRLYTVLYPVGGVSGTLLYEYDALGRLQAFHDNPQNGPMTRTTSYAYSYAGGKLTSSVTDPENNIHTSFSTPDGTFQSATSFGQTVTRTLDLTTNQIITQSRDGKSVMTLDKDWSWQNYQITAPGGSTLAQGSRTVDGLGRTATTQSQALGRATSTTYDTYGSPTQINASGVAPLSLSYGRGSTFTATASQGGVTTRSTWDAQRRHLGTTGYGAPDTSWSHAVGTSGPQTSLQTGGSTTRWNSAASGASSDKTYLANGTSERATYYPGGLPQQVTLPNGVTVGYTYTSQGEVNSITYGGGPSGTISIPTISLGQRDGLGRVKTATDASGTRAINYTADHVATENYTSGLLSGYNLTRNWEDGLQRKLTLTGPGGLSETISYGYDGNRNPSTLTSGSQQGGVAISSQGLLVAMRAPKAVHSADYANAQLTSWTSGSLSYTYNHDDLGRRTQETLGDGTAWAYTYTGTGEGYAGQLKTATLKNASATPGGQFTYAYNAMGVRQTSDRSGFADTTLGNNLNQVTTRTHNRCIPVWGQKADSSTALKAGIGITQGLVTSYRTTTGSLTIGNAATLIVRLPHAGQWDFSLLWASAGSSAATLQARCADTSQTLTLDQTAGASTVTFQTDGPAFATLILEGASPLPALPVGYTLQQRVPVGQTTPPALCTNEAPAWKNYTDRSSSLTSYNGWFYSAMQLPDEAQDAPGVAHVWVRATTPKVGGGSEYRHTLLLFPYGPAATTYGYDASGQQNADWRWEYKWTADGRLGKLTTSTAARNAGFANETIDYTYDAEGRRVAREHRVDGNLQRKAIWVYDGFLPLYEKETNATGGDLAERLYVWSPTAHASGGVSGLLWYRERVGTVTKVRSPLYDGRGNLVGLVDGNTGQQVALYYYGPFGEPVGRRGEPTTIGFATHYTDPVTGLVDFGQRWYNPTTGHWISREPLGEGVSANLYAYCNNDPVNYVDYLGLAKLDSRCPDPKKIQAYVIHLEGKLEAIPSVIQRTYIMGSSYLEHDENGEKKQGLKNEIEFWKDILKVHQLTGSDGYDYVSQKYKTAMVEVYGSRWQEKSDDYYHTYFMRESPWMSDQRRAELTANQKSIASFSRFSENYLTFVATIASLPIAGESAIVISSGESRLMAMGARNLPINLEAAISQRALAGDAVATRGFGLMGLRKARGIIDKALMEDYLTLAKSNDFVKNVSTYNRIAGWFGQKQIGSIDEIIVALETDTTFARTSNYWAAVLSRGKHMSASQFWLQGNPLSLYGARAGRHELLHLGAALRGQQNTWIHEVAVQAASTPEILMLETGIIVTSGGIVIKSLVDN